MLNATLARRRRAAVVVGIAHAFMCAEAVYAQCAAPGQRTPLRCSTGAIQVISLPVHGGGDDGGGYDERTFMAKSAARKYQGANVAIGARLTGDTKTGTTSAAWVPPSANFVFTHWTKNSEFYGPGTSAYFASMSPDLESERIQEYQGMQFRRSAFVNTNWMCFLETASGCVAIAWYNVLNVPEGEAYYIPSGDDDGTGGPSGGGGNSGGGGGGTVTICYTCWLVDPVTGEVLSQWECGCEVHQL